MRWRNQRNLYGSQNCLSPRYVIRNSLGVSRNNLMDCHAASPHEDPPQQLALHRLDAVLLLEDLLVMLVPLEVVGVLCIPIEPHLT